MSRSARLLVVLGLNLVLVAGLVAVGLAARSLGVLAAAVDYLGDAAAVGVALVALRLAARSRRLGRPTGGRAQAAAALVNATWLAVLSAVVAAGAVDRLVTGVPSVRGLPVLVMSAVAALAMVGGALVLGGDVEDDTDEDGALSLRAVLLDTAADAASAGGVAVTGAVIYVTHGLEWLDPAVALVIAVVVGAQALRLLREVGPRLRRRGLPASVRH